jgi:hypothetical protein
VRTLATPDGIDTCSLTSLRERLVKTGVPDWCAMLAMQSSS